MTTISLLHKKYDLTTLVAFYLISWNFDGLIDSDVIYHNIKD